jgi:aminoglycoside phosphotransferase (APT) family kinase protein
MQIDQATSVRKGEELSEPALRSYLSEELDAVEPSQPLGIRQFPGGHSNLTYLISQGTDEYILRCPPVGSKVKSAHDMGREYRVLSKLGPAYAKAPTPLLYCEDDSIIGSSFYVMQRVRGAILRKDFPPDVEATPELLTRMCHSFVETLVELHEIDYQEIGLGELGRPEGYVQRQVQGWSKRYQDAKTDEIPAVDFLSSWLQEHIPSSAHRASLIHNDFKFDNLVLAESDMTRVVGILDWEMTTLGDPLMDLGTTLSYWVQADDPEATHSLRFGPTHLEGMMTRQALVEAYAKRSGCSLDDILFYYVFGLFKSLGIVQQIYYRFHKGLTKDPRFGQFIHAVRILSDQANLAIERDHL